MRTSSYYDINEGQARQYIDACQCLDAMSVAIRNSATYCGSMFWRSAGGHDYLIKTVAGIEKSLGRKDDKTQKIYEAFRTHKQAAKERMASLRLKLAQHERVNAALRVGRAPEDLIKVLNILNKAGIGDHFLVIGTNALFAYEMHAGVRFDPDLTATGDVDLLWDSRKHVTLASSDPSLDEEGLIGILRKADSSFVMDPEIACRAINASGYMVDLIKRRPESYFDDHEKGQLRPIVGDFWAAKIRNMDWLLSSPRFAQTIVSARGKMAQMVTVDPRAFVLYKLYLAEKEDRDPVKKPRDIAQASAVTELIEDRLPHLRFEDVHVFPERIRKMRRQGPSGAPLL